LCPFWALMFYTLNSSCVFFPNKDPFINSFTVHLHSLRSEARDNTDEISPSHSAIRTFVVRWTKVRPSLVATPPYRATLAGCSMSESCTSSASWCSTACTLKRLRTSRNCVKLSTSRRCCIRQRSSATSPIRHPTAPGRTAPPYLDARHRLSFYVRRAFCVAGPSVWHSLPDSLRNPIIGGNSFKQSLKTFLFATYWCTQCITGFTTMRYIKRLLNFLLTYLLTYLLT